MNLTPFHVCRALPNFLPDGTRNPKAVKANLNTKGRAALEVNAATIYLHLLCALRPCRNSPYAFSNVADHRDAPNKVHDPPGVRRARGRARVVLATADGVGYSSAEDELDRLNGLGQRG
jgi:hypothetical protein